MFSCKFWKIFKSIFFTEHLLITASVKCLQSQNISKFTKSNTSILDNKLCQQFITSLQLSIFDSKNHIRPLIKKDNQIKRKNYYRPIRTTPNLPKVRAYVSNNKCHFRKSFNAQYFNVGEVEIQRQW